MIRDVAGWRVVPFKFEHALEFDLFANEQYREAMALRARSGGFTAMKEMFDDEHYLCAGGITPYWSGVGEAWFLGSPLVKIYPLAAYKICRMVIDHLISEFKLHRVHSIVDASDLVAVKFAQSLGFLFESTLHKWSSKGTDFYMMARVL